MCLHSCKEDSDNTSATSKDFTLDLNQAAFSRLKTPGNFVVEQDVVIACTGPGAYAAVTVICSHEGKKQVAYQSASNDFRCSAHGATFDVQGKGKSGPSSAGLRVYQTSLNGSSLRVFS
jgi:nitrite reductase/ring-hydroxylating ferredoxin subunit